MANRKLDEMCGSSSAAGSAVVGGGAPFTRKVIKRKMREVTTPFTTNETNIKGKVEKTAAVYKKGKKGYKIAKVAETKSESMLREAIKNLIFLNRIKYHEENVKREMQEQKLRKIIRHLLNEEKGQVLMTTGENNANDFLSNIKSTTFEQLYAKLSSVKDQREAFKATYKEKLELYLDSLDQQHVLLNPDDRPQGNTADQGNISTVPPEVAGAPPQETAPEPAGLAEAAAQPVAMPQGVGAIAPDTSRLQTQVLAAQLKKSDLHPTGVQAALKALKKDLPQVDAFYSPLTFRPLQLPAGEVISDREAFRRMLFGHTMEDGSNYPGNIDGAFQEIDNGIKTSDSPGSTPAQKPSEPAPVPTGTTPGEPAQLTAQGDEEEIVPQEEPALPPPV